MERGEREQHTDHQRVNITASDIELALHVRVSREEDIANIARAKKQDIHGLLFALSVRRDVLCQTAGGGIAKGVERVGNVRAGRGQHLELILTKRNDTLKSWMTTKENKEGGRSVNPEETQIRCAVATVRLYEV